MGETPALEELNPFLKKTPAHFFSLRISSCRGSRALPFGRDTVLVLVFFEAQKPPFFSAGIARIFFFFSLSPWREKGRVRGVEPFCQESGLASFL